MIPVKPEGAPFVDVCATTDVPEGEPLPVEARGRSFLVCRVGDGFHAVADRCTHAAWPLAGSDLVGSEIVCGLHGGRFDLHTGVATTAPASKPIRTFPVRIRDDRIEVQVPLPPR